MKLEGSHHNDTSENAAASQPDDTTRLSSHAPLSNGSFVAILAGLMGINALAVDVILPAFPDIADALGTDITSVQLIVTAYTLGFGLSQIFMGFLADRFGRKPILLIGLLIYGIAAAASAFSTGLTMILIFRFLQGIGAGAPRVIAVAAARDCYEGRELARVMSLAMTMFMSVPIFAPLIGQGIWVVSGWREIFIVLVIYALGMTWICWRHFPETLSPGKRRGFEIPLIVEALRSVFGNLQTVGYAIAGGLFFGSLFGFIVSAQQLLVDAFDLGLWFPIVFAGMAVFMSTASFVNSLLVNRFGMRLLSHGAVIANTLISAVLFLLSWTGNLHAAVFIALHAANLLLVGLIFANFNALAMEPQGHIAGVAASFVSAVTVILGTGIGYFIGRAFDGTTTPLTFGFFMCGAGTLVVLLIVEKGKLFQAHHGR